MKFHEIDIRGTFKLPIENTYSSVSHVGSQDQGRIFYSETEDAVYYGDRDEWILLTGKYDVFTNGTQVLMCNFPLPDNWNIVNRNDMAVIVVSGGVNVGVTGGTWAITGSSNEGSHSHTGLTGTSDSNNYVGKSEIYASVTPTAHRHGITPDGLHTHTFDGAWRPKYAKFALVRYDA